MDNQDNKAGQQKSQLRDALVFLGIIIVAGVIAVGYFVLSFNPSSVAEPLSYKIESNCGGTVSYLRGSGMEQKSYLKPGWVGSPAQGQSIHSLSAQADSENCQVTILIRRGKSTVKSASSNGNYVVAALAYNGR